MSRAKSDKPVERRQKAEAEALPEAGVRLTHRQRAFIAEYLKCWNAAEAARRAGYSPKGANVTGAQNLAKPNIRAAIDERMRELMMEADEALYRLSEIARGTMADFVDPERATIDLDRAAAAGKLGLIKGFSRTTTLYGGTVRIELYDAQDALKHILNERRLRTGDATSRLDVTSGGKPIKGYIGISPDDWDEPQS